MLPDAFRMDAVRPGMRGGTDCSCNSRLGFFNLTCTLQHKLLPTDMPECVKVPEQKARVQKHCSDNAFRAASHAQFVQPYHWLVKNNNLFDNGR